MKMEYRSEQVAIGGSAKTSTGIFLLTLYENDDDLPTKRYWVDGNKETISFFISEGTGTNIGEVAFTKKD